MRAAGAVSADARAHSSWNSIIKVGQNHLHTAAGTRENQGLDVVAEQLAGEVNPCLQAAGTQTQLLIHQRRIVNQEVPPTVRRAILVDQRGRAFYQLFSKFFRIADGSGGEDELRVGLVKRSDPFKPADDIGNVRAEHPAVGMHFIYNHIPEPRKELAPEGVVR